MSPSPYGELVCAARYCAAAYDLAVCVRRIGEDSLRADYNEQICPIVRFAGNYGKNDGERAYGEVLKAST